MVKRKKHAFHCAHCGNELQIYKKGKGHRVMVCPKHGIIAVNPGLGAFLGGAIGSVIPGAGTAIGATIGGVAENLISSRQTTSTAERSPRAVEKHYIDSLDKPNQGERIVNKELYGE